MAEVEIFCACCNSSTIPPPSNTANLHIDDENSCQDFGKFPDTLKDFIGVLILQIFPKIYKKNLI